MNAAGMPSQTGAPSIGAPREALHMDQSRVPVPSSRSVTIPGPAGRLEALLNNGSSKAPFAALLCHPNPAYGGNMHHKVLYRAMKVLNDPAWGLGWPVLRFNFRGTGLSEGTHDGKAELEDVLAALDWLNAEFHLPMFVGGFSFGSAMALWACCGPHKTTHPLKAVFALGLPTQAGKHQYHYRFLNDASIPKLFLSGDSDAFGPAEQLTQITAAAAEPKRLVLIRGADHFFTHHLEPMQQSLARWIKEQLP